MPTLHVTLGGVLVGAQRWSIGHWVDSALSLNPAQLSTFAEQCRALFDTNVWSASTNPLKGANPNTVNLDQCRVYQYAGATGPANSVGVSTGAAVAATVSVPNAPSQCALVCTLESGLAGRNNRGRMYLPYGNPTFVAGYLITPTIALARASQIATYLSAVNVISGAGAPYSVVVSRQNAHQLLSAVSVDTRCDTQRRRADKVVGTRSRAAVVIG